MKRALKILTAVLLLVMSMPFVAYANNDEEDIVEVEEGYIPYSPELPQDWTEDQWNEWGLAFDTCLIPAVERAQTLVAEARAILAAAGVIAAAPSGTPVAATAIPIVPSAIPIVPSATPVVPSATLIVSSTFSVEASSRNIDITPEQIELLLALIDHYTDLYERMQNFLYAFETTDMSFEFAIAYIYELCEEFLGLNIDLENALPVEEEPEPEQPSLPQTGTAVALTSIGVAGVALTIIGAMIADTKRKNKNS